MKIFISKSVNIITEASVAIDYIIIFSESLLEIDPCRLKAERKSQIVIGDENIVGMDLVMNVELGFDGFKLKVFLDIISNPFKY
uniref:Uncharacterized protein n=1 Tax=Lactuca sativa TaxID=4236 RepID=A0A9R1X8X9_LACSA|nr:hypothetical protein LSAT_V11C500270090 [Lactuca sativa]